MIGRIGVLAGALGGLVYVGLVGAYALVADLSVPPLALAAAGALAVTAAAGGTEVVVVRIEARERSQDI